MGTIKVIHISDLHYSPQNLIESDRCTGYSIQYAESAKPDLFIISGDATDHRIDVHSEAAKALIGRVKQASNIAPVILLQGTFSHEPKGTLKSIAHCQGKHPIFVADKLQQIIFTKEGNFIGSSDEHFTEKDQDLLFNAKSVITAIPVLNQAEIAAKVGTGRDIQYEMRQYILEYIKNSQKFIAMAKEADIPTLGISHGTVYQSITEHGFLMTKDHEFMPEDMFDTGCSAFLLGHIHRHQYWTNDQGQIAAYPGSIGCFHFGDDDPKGFLEWNISSIRAEFKFIQTPAQLKKTVTFNSEPDLKVLEELRDFEGELRIQYLVNEENLQCVDRVKIESMLPNAEITYDQRIVKIHRSRAEGISLENDLASKLEHWSKATGEKIDNLQSKLILLQEKSVQEIVRESLSPA
ncbi:metallophosphoesterase [Flavobacterium sp.]|uniref:metallophosphoesterase family protein n=1 Tax=Flavobacterium sp. TaxID=239 RepID=UPI0026288128|nr:metallophosphoesterase [Flavobacterium sp.]